MLVAKTLCYVNSYYSVCLIHVNSANAANIFQNSYSIKFIMLRCITHLNCVNVAKTRKCNTEYDLLYIVNNNKSIINIELQHTCAIYRVQ